MVIYKDMLIRQCDRLCYAAFSKKTYFFLVRVAMETNKVFSGYFAGKRVRQGENYVADDLLRARG